MSSLYGSQSCQQIGRDPAGWFNPEFQMHGLSSTGTMTIWSQENCTTSFPRSLAAASAKAFFGTWLCFTGSTPNGAILQPFSLTVLSWMQRPISESDFKRGCATMNERTLPLLCDPDTHDSLRLNAGGLLIRSLAGGIRSGTAFPNSCRKLRESPDGCSLEPEQLLGISTSNIHPVVVADRSFSNQSLASTTSS